MKIRERPEDQGSTRPPPSGEKRGELFWRGVRYLTAVGAGYLLGLSAGRLGGDSPGWPIIVVVGAVALFLIFRKGQQSNSHAAADAISAAHASARAAAVAQNQITVAGGHVVQGTQQIERVWDDDRYLEHVEQRDALSPSSPPDWHGWSFFADHNGTRLYQHAESGVIRSSTELPPEVRSSIARAAL